MLAAQHSRVLMYGAASRADTLMVCRGYVGGKGERCRYRLAGGERGRGRFELQWRGRSEYLVVVVVQVRGWDGDATFLRGLEIG